MTTPELLDACASVLEMVGGHGPSMASELRIRGYRLVELQHQAAPERNDLTGQTPFQILQTVNAPPPH